MKPKLSQFVSITAMLLAVEMRTAKALDLLERYPTQLTVGDAVPGNARPWEFKDEDVLRVSQFTFALAKLRVEVGPADLGIGHCKDGAVWAVVLPREATKLASAATSQEETISHVWLRFHPGQLDSLFRPDTVFAEGNSSLAAQIRAIANAKFRSSWHAGPNAMIPEPKDMTIDVDTTAGPRRFFVVDTQAGTAEYVAAFEDQSMHPSGANSNSHISLESAPPVVVKTIPEAGATGVDPALTEIQVTFSKPMQNGSWSWSTWGQENFPEITGEIHYLADGRTCVLPVKLTSGKFYASWLNSDKFHNFKDASQRPAVPYLLTFRTAGAAENGAEAAPK